MSLARTDFGVAASSPMRRANLLLSDDRSTEGVKTSGKSWYSGTEWNEYANSPSVLQ